MEIHEKGKIKYELHTLESDGELGAKLPIKDYMPEIENEEVETKIDNFLVVHIPNYKINSLFWGISDYKDLMSLFFSINNRITKIDNILDKHGDPILAVPEGVLDEDGQVSRQSFGVIEVPTGETSGSKPEYIVWDAKLESAFKEIEILTQNLFTTSETSPSILGLDREGVAESGRALKFRLLRTIAKKHRKELYFDWGIKRLLNTAQAFAIANDLKINGVKSKKPSGVQIEWQDGIINDAKESLEIEQMRLDNGITTKKDVLKRLEGLDDEEADEKLKEIEEERKNNAPKFNASPFLNKDQSNE